MRRTMRIKPTFNKATLKVFALAITVVMCTLVILSAIAPFPEASQWNFLSIGTGQKVLANPAFTARFETYFNAATLTTPFDATLSKPFDTAEGEILFTILCWNGVATIDSVPSGWTLLGDYTSNTDKYALYYKVAGSSEPSSYTWSFSASCKARIVCSCYTGGDFNPSDPIDVVSNTAYRTSDAIVRAAAMSVANANSPLVFWASVYYTATATFTKPSSPGTWIEDDDTWSTTPDFGNEICSQIWSGSGSTGNIDAICNASLTAKHAFAVALNPPSVAPTVTTQAATNVNSVSCTGNGNITATGGANAHTRGFCYMVGTSGDPTTANSTVYDNGAGSYGTGTYTKSITSLTPSTGYRVRAYAINSAGTGYGATVQVTTLPGDPSALTDTAHGGTSIDLSWTKGTGADYTLIRYRTDQYPTGTSDGILGYNSTAATTSVGSLTYGQIYYFRAWAWNSTTTLYSSGTSDRTAFTDPAAPTAFTVTERTSSSVTLNWAKGTGADKTRVQYRTDQYPTTYSDGTQAYFDTGTSTNVTSLSAGQIYYFRAWSYDTESGYYDSYAQLTDYTLPADPSALNASNPTVSTIDVSWTKGTGGDKTMVRYAEVDYPEYGTGTQLYFDTGTSQQATSLDSNSTYYFRCWSYDSDSGYHSSGYSSDTETTLTPAPEITNTPDNYGFGILSVDTTSNTAINYFTLNNTGNCPVDVTIQGTDMSGGDDTWDLSDTATPGENIYGLYVGLDDVGDLFDIIVRETATYNTLVSDLAEGITQAWGLKLYMPTSVSGYDVQQMSGTVTLVASASS